MKGLRRKPTTSKKPGKDAKGRPLKSNKYGEAAHGGLYGAWKGGSIKQAKAQGKKTAPIHAARATTVAFLATLPLSLPIAAIVGAIQGVSGAKKDRAAEIEEAKKYGEQGPNAKLTGRETRRNASFGARNQLAMLNPLGGLRVTEVKSRKQKKAEAVRAKEIVEANAPKDNDAAPEETEDVAQAIERDPQVKEAATEVLEQNKDVVEKDMGSTLEELVGEAEESEESPSQEMSDEETMKATAGGALAVGRGGAAIDDPRRRSLG
jgi:hypothetical protein